MNVSEELFAVVQKSVASALEVDDTDVEVAWSNEPEKADIATAVFKFAAQKHQSPQDLAESLVSVVDENLRKWAGADSQWVVQAERGYVNVKIDNRFLARRLHSDMKSNIFGTSDEGRGKTVIVDFIGLNMSKPFSVGHLRPTVQGWSLIQIFRALGYQVIGDSHLGDWGTPFGMWVVAFEKWGSEEALERDGVYELGRLYVEFRNRAKEDETLIDQAKVWLKRLESGDEQAAAYRQRFLKISMDHANSVLEQLGIQADENLGESFYVERAQKLVDELVSQGKAEQQADNSVIIDLTDEEIETPILLRKADGSILYATTDVETIRYRQERWHPRKIIYSVGAEQQFHFKQVFAAAKKLGLSGDAELVHAWFGTIDEIDSSSGKRGKMSSRKDTALLEELLKTARLKAQELVASGKSLSDEDVETIAIGAIKFNDFVQPRRTNILFEWERMFSLQGHSATYVQYAAVRVNSILKNLAVVDAGADNLSDYDWQAERQLLLWLARYPGVVRSAAAQYEPYLIAHYAYELAKLWNRYYETTPVSTSEDSVLIARSWLLEQLSHNFAHALGLLGIQIPSKM